MAAGGGAGADAEEAVVAEADLGGVGVVLAVLMVVGSLPRRAVVSRIEASVVGRLIDRDPGRTRYSSL